MLEAHLIAAEEPVQQTGEADSAQPSAPADSAAAMELEDDVVPELPEYEDDGDADDDQGTDEEVMSEHRSEPVSPARPYSGSYSAPVTPAKSGKKGWSLKRMFGSSKKRGRDGGEGIEDDAGNALPTARSISASELNSPLTTPRKKKGGRLARMLGRKRQVLSKIPSAIDSCTECRLWMSSNACLRMQANTLRAAAFAEFSSSHPLQWGLLPFRADVMEGCLRRRHAQAEDAASPASRAPSEASTAELSLVPARRSSFSATVKKALFPN